ncbi:hypothetical protein [Sorangium cellulosum]|uniref:hypothetical protein n=1 Tax=Sorangium cellulosum TaxID=56 RepID=UPI001F5D3C6E|nr:hypothetical protein [Sorangium cellulosum]
MRLSSATRSRSSRDVISGAPRSSWFTISKIFSSISAGRARDESRLPIARCAAARSPSGTSE